MIEEIKFKNKILSEDRDYYEEFVIETKKENKALKTELLGFYAQRNGSPKAKPMTADETEGRRTKITGFREEIGGGKDKDSFFQTQPLSGVSWEQKKTGGAAVDELRRLKNNEEKYQQKINLLQGQIDHDRLILKFLFV